MLQPHFLLPSRNLHGRRVHRLTVLLVLAIAVPLADHPGSAQAFTVLKNEGAGGSSSPAEVAVKFHDVNQVRLAVTSTGQIGNDLRTGNGAGFWPKSTLNSYVFGAGIWIGALADIDGDGDRDELFVQGYDPLSGGSEFRTGRAAQDPADPVATLFASTDPEDLALWPEEFREIDNDPQSPTYGRSIPRVISDQDLVAIYTTLGKMPLFGRSPPLEVRQRSLAFRAGLSGNVILFFFDIENLSERIPTGPFTLEEAFLGFDADVDIGVEYTDDRTSYFTSQVTPEGDTIPLHMAFAWDRDFQEYSYSGDPGFLGFAFIQSPGNDYDGIDNDNDGMIDESPFNGIDDDGDGLIDEMPDEVDQLGLVNYSFHCGPSTCNSRPDPQDDPEGYRIMSCNPPDECIEVTEATDIRFMMSSGPLRIRPGETHRMVVAFVFANAVGDPADIPVYGDPPRPDPNDIYFQELLATRSMAQAIFDLDFVKAPPPPAPKVTLVPGDRQITVLWDSGPVHAPDEMYADLVGLDPSYREYDFEGFRLWRSRTGMFSTDGDPDDPLNPLARARNEENPDLDLTLLGQWDLDDGITTENNGIDTLDYIVDDDTGRFLVALADTFDLGTDTGLRFSFLDTGDPALPLVNGLRYYYCVESYDYNPSDIPLSRLSTRSGVRFSHELSCSPRSNASSFVPAAGMIAHVDSLGALLPDDTPEEFIFEEPPQATDALRDYSVTLPVDSRIEDTYHDFILDEIVPDGWYTSEIFYHVEDASGQRLPVEAEVQSLFTMRYDSVVTSVYVTVHDPADTTMLLYELELELFADRRAYRYPQKSDLTAADAEGNDITETLGILVIDLNDFVRLGYRGTDIRLLWQQLGPDTLTLSVEDTGNRVSVPYRGSAHKGLNWHISPGGNYLIGHPDRLEVYISGVTFDIWNPPRYPTAGDVWTLGQRSFYVDAEGDTIPGSRPPVPGTRYRLNLTSGGQDQGEIDLAAIRVVPNPYLGYSDFESGGAARKIQFVNLPPECTIRIYTISGVLVRVLAHTASGAGTENYDLLTREGLPLASGNYYYHVTVPDGRTHLGRFAVIR